MFSLNLNRITLSLIFIIIGAVLYLFDLELTAEVGVPIAISFILMSAVSKKDDALTLSYLSGVLLGVAGLVWVYALLAFVALVIYMFVVLKANSIKILWSFVFGIVTPFWIALPFYIYYNHGTIIDIIKSYI